ncbi:terminase small subunit [Agrobacterium pusense]|uniref:terminase small subunit n=1 Tax=Agrobacterium pusense TaxID=648995 RepID=UPI000D1B2829|nr:terminase small subunit [Agrobacterium pusense]
MSTTVDLSDLLDDPAPRPMCIAAVMDERQLAAFLGITPATVRTMARDGLALKAGRGRYDVAETVRVYAGNLRTRATGRPAPDNDALKAERLRLTAAQATREEIRVEQQRGLLIASDEVARQWANVLRDVRNALLAVPSRCGASLPHLSAADIATLEREIHAALEALADGN